MTELVVSSVLIGVSLAAIGELVVLNTYASTKLTNKVDGQMGCSRAVRRITEDVRCAKLIGNNNSLNRKNSFPDTISGADPYYDLTPNGGWPSTPWTPPPYELGPRTLILQQPVIFDDGTSTNPLNGFPLKFKKDSISPGVPPQTVECLDTLVYRVIPDPDHVDMYILQVARFPGNPSLTGFNLKSPINPPQTVLTGIVGPLDPSEPSAGPAVFQYLKTPNDNAALRVPTSSDTLSLRGVSINIEAQVPSSNQGSNLEITAVHSETFLRSSKYLHLVSDGTE